MGKGKPNNPNKIVFHKIDKDSNSISTVIIPIIKTWLDYDTATIENCNEIIRKEITDKNKQVSVKVVEDINDRKNNPLYFFCTKHLEIFLRSKNVFIINRDKRI